MNITKKEIMFSSIIVLVMLALGLFISNKISESDMKKQEMYYKALRIEDSSEFAYAYDTKVGNILANGVGIASNPVSLPELSDEYSVISVVKQRYTEHVTYETVKDSEGNTRTERKVTYSWDNVHTDNYFTDTVNYMGKILPIDAFHFDGGERLNLSSVISPDYERRVRNNHLYEGIGWTEYVGAVRWNYYGISKEFTGTLFLNVLNEINVKNTSFYLNTNIRGVLNQIDKNMRIHQIVFWVIWVIVIIGLVIGFYYFENNWLEDKGIHFNKTRKFNKSY